MIVKQYIKEFEKLGLGMFVHFGLYSQMEKGEWVKARHSISDEEYCPLAETFNPKEEWAKELVSAAKGAGCKYIVLTTRHHDGFSLYDTCGLNTYDAPHAKCKRDLVREFVDACREEDIIPFFYHTMFDWHEKSCETDFPKYLEYHRASVEILCRNYGKIGGLWFDGTWKMPNHDWEPDKLYALIRKYQPEAMIINNTGIDDLGALGHIELDSVTFERGKPFAINLESSPKYIASEMCEAFGEHWGYAADDLNYKSPATLIRELADCRKYGSNMLLNVGPMGDGSLNLLDRGLLDYLGRWTSYFDEAIRSPRPSGIEIKDKTEDFILKDGRNYYLFCYDIPMMEFTHHRSEAFYRQEFELEDQIASVTWMDTGTELKYTQEGKQVTIHTVPYDYGRNLVVRVAKIACK